MLRGLRLSAVFLLVVCGVSALDSANARSRVDTLAITTVAPGCDGFDFDAAVIGNVEVDNANIFDLSRPDEDKWLYRLANRLHIRTRPDVIRNQLLFKSGDRYSQRALDESARLLRGHSYFYDAGIELLRCADGKVDVKVTTHDVWSLNPGLSFGRSGGKNTSGFEFEELNLLGTGTQINIARKNGVDRDSTLFRFGNDHLFGSRLSLDLGYSSNSDGSNKSLALTRPFYSLDSNWAASLTAQDNDRIDKLYDLSKVRDEFREQQRFLRIDGGWSRGVVGDWVQRWGVGLVYDERRFSAAPDPSKSNLLPEDRKFVYPLVSYELLQDDYRLLRNRDQIGRTEDTYFGMRFRAEVGYAGKGFGSTQDAWILGATLSHGKAFSSDESLLLATSLSARAEQGRAQNAVLGAEARYYRRLSTKRLFFSTLRADFGSNLDLDNQLLLGGDNGLRGYPLRYQAGDKRVLFTLEQRYYTDWYPWRLFRVGGAMFLDVGKVWGDNPVGGQSRGVLKDVGFGLRLGNTRTGLGNVVHIDIAFPLDRAASVDSVQFLVETKRSF